LLGPVAKLSLFLGGMLSRPLGGQSIPLLAILGCESMTPDAVNSATAF
jgi:hypothetical protein